MANLDRELVRNGHYKRGPYYHELKRKPYTYVYKSGLINELDILSVDILSRVYYNTLQCMQ